MKHPSLVVLYSVFGIITGTATFILSTESGFLRDAFFRECDVRFYAENSPEHEHRIAIHNSAAQPIDVSVIETFTPEMSLVDLTFAAVDPSGETSFLQVLRGASSTQRNGDGLGDVLASLDAHYEPASLRSVDTALRKAREHRIARLGSTGSSMSKHIQRLSKCSGDPERPDCKDEVEVERWERSVLEMTNTAATSWRTITGLNLSPGTTLCPEHKIMLLGSIPSNRTEFLTFKFDQRLETTAEFKLLLGKHSATELGTASDLDKNPTWIAMKYYPGRSLLFGMLSVALVLVFRFVSRQSTRHLTRRELANAALASPPSRNESLWSELYNRTRPYLSADYRHACRTLGKTPDLSAFELFDHIKNFLIIQYGEDSAPFESERGLEERLHGYIQQLANI